jgi:hypothetical protein
MAETDRAAARQDLPWSEHEQLAEIIGAAVVQGNIDWDSRTLGLRAIEAIHKAGYALNPVHVVIREGDGWRRIGCDCPVIHKKICAAYCG